MFDFFFTSKQILKCVSIDMQFYIFLQVFACQMPKIGKDHTLVGVSMYREEHTRKKHGNFTWLTMFFSSVCQCFVCIFDKVFASSWHLTCRNLHTQKNARPLTHTIQDLTCSVTCEKKNHMSIDMLKIEMTRMTEHVTLR